MRTVRDVVVSLKNTEVKSNSTMGWTQPPKDVVHDTTSVTMKHPPFSTTKVLAVEADLAQFFQTLDPNARPKHFKNAFEEWIFVFTVMMCTAATTFLQGVIIINTAMIGRDLKMTAAQVAWISAAIGLASGSFMLFFGKTADIFGRKPQLLCGLIFLAIFSLITAFAPTPMGMNVLCGFLGLGTAIISPPGIGTLFATYPEGRRRNKAAGALGAGNPVGFILGSVASGIATKYWTWRAPFVVISIFFVIMTLLAVWTMPSMSRSGNSSMQVRQFDYFGTLLTILGMALFSAGLTQGPEAGWKSSTVLVPLILGVFCLLGFCFWEHIFLHPLLNPVVWKNRTFTLCVLCTMTGYMSFITNQFWISLYMQDVQKLSPLHIAARLLPQAFAGIFWSYLGQALTDKVNGTILMGVGGIAYVIGAVLLIFIRENTSYWKLLFPSLMITVLGADFQFIISNLYITKQMPRQASLAAGVLQTAMRLSIAIGLGITSAVFGSAKTSDETVNDTTNPYVRAHLCGAIFATTALLFIPFMNIEPQGTKPVEIAQLSEGQQLPPRTYSSEQSNGSASTESDVPRTLKSQSSNASGWSGATLQTQGSYFPRWSWEDERWLESRGDSYRGAEVVYEVCVKCLEERKVVADGSTDASMINEATNHTNNVNDGVRVVWNSPRGLANQSINGTGRSDWIFGEWNNEWNNEWYSQRGVSDIKRNGWL